MANQYVKCVSMTRNLFLLIVVCSARRHIYQLVSKQMRLSDPENCPSYRTSFSRQSVIELCGPDIHKCCLHVFKTKFVKFAK